MNKIFVRTQNMPIKHVFTSTQNQQKPSFNNVSLWLAFAKHKQAYDFIFLKSTRWHEYIRPNMALLPSFRFLTAEAQFLFANTGVDFFGPLCIKDSKRIVEKHYGIIITCMVTLVVHLEACPDLNTDTFLNN